MFKFFVNPRLFSATHFSESPRFSSITKYFLTFLTVLSLSGCFAIHPENGQGKPITHQEFTVYLKKYVDNKGFVNYKAMSTERAPLTAYLLKLQNNLPDTNTWSKNEQLAYWINVYNAYTLELVLTHYPVKSIKDIGSKIQIPFVNSPWDIEFIPVGSKRYSLNTIEHQILRANFNEPRIHFAINCASVSCPILLNEAYESTILEEQLKKQTREFLTDLTRNKIFEQNEIFISEIFNWFQGDFTKQIPLIEFITKHSGVQISKKAKIRYLEYDWALNGK